MPSKIKRTSRAEGVAMLVSFLRLLATDNLTVPVLCERLGVARVTLYRLRTLAAGCGVVIGNVSPGRHWCVVDWGIFNKEALKAKGA